MNALADKARKQGMLHSDMHSITWPHYSTTIPTQVAVNLSAEWRATANYVGMVVE